MRMAQNWKKIHTLCSLLRINFSIMKFVQSRYVLVLFSSKIYLALMFICAFFCLFSFKKASAASNGHQNPFAKPNPRPRCVVKANSVSSPAPVSNKPQIAPRVRFLNWLKSFLTENK